MRRTRLASIPAVRRKWAADAAMIAAYASTLALLVALGTHLNLFVGAFMAVIGTCCVLGFMMRQELGRMDGSSPGIMPVRDRARCPVLWDAVHACAAVVGVPAPKIYLFDRRVPLQAASWGFWEHRSIGMQRSLVERLPGEWVAATVAHEIAHIAMGDLLTSSILVILRSWLRAIVPFSVVAGILAGIGSSELEKLLAGVLLVALALLASLASDLAEVCWKPHLRYQREYAADALAIAITGDPVAAMGLMLFLAVSMGQRSTDPRPLPGRTHPPPLVRIEAILRDHPHIFR